jgi:hypothetical protein
MKTRFLKIISGMALATVLALTVTQVSAFAQSAQKQQGIEGVWDVRITVVQCDTGKAIGTEAALCCETATASIAPRAEPGETDRSRS